MPIGDTDTGASLYFDKLYPLGLEAIDEAVAAPRIHHQWIPHRVSVEEAVPEAVVEGLRARGHEIQSRRAWSAAESIRVDAASGWHLGANDPRRDGLAVGYTQDP